MTWRDNLASIGAMLAAKPTASFDRWYTPPAPTPADDPERRQPLMAQTSVVTAAGTMTASFESVGAGQKWLIDGFVIKCTSSTSTTGTLYSGAPSPSTELDTSANANTDRGSWDPPLELLPGDTATFVWAGATAPAVATARLSYRLVTL